MTRVQHKLERVAVLACLKIIAQETIPSEVLNVNERE